MVASEVPTEHATHHRRRGRRDAARRHRPPCALASLVQRASPCRSTAGRRQRAARGRAAHAAIAAIGLRARSRRPFATARGARRQSRSPRGTRCARTRRLERRSRAARAEDRARAAHRTQADAAAGARCGIVRRARRGRPRPPGRARRRRADANRRGLRAAAARTGRARARASALRARGPRRSRGGGVMVNAWPLDAYERVLSRAHDLRDAFRAGAVPLNDDVRTAPARTASSDPLSVVPPPGAWLVTRGADGVRAYGRDGALALDGGVLRTRDGAEVLGYPGGDARGA